MPNAHSPGAKLDRLRGLAGGDGDFRAVGQAQAIDLPNLGKLSAGEDQCGEDLPHSPGRIAAAKAGYALTRICLDRHIMRVPSVFETIAEPSRRAILSLLASSERSVGEIERQLRLPQPTVSKHLRVLREAGFVEATVDAQRRLYRLRPEPLQEVDSWLAQFRGFWSTQIDALERHLDQAARSASRPIRTAKEKTWRR